MIQNQLPVLSLDSIPKFTLYSHTGDTITREDIKGKILISDFFFTTCRGICPVMSRNMAELHKYLNKNEKARTKFILLSHTVDPRRDSIPVLKKYAELYGADGSMWHMVTGEKQQLYDLAINFYKLPALEAPEDTLHPYAHSERFTLIDREGFIRGYYDGTDTASVNKLLGDIAKLDIIEAMRSVKKDREDKNKITWGKEEK